MAVCTESTVGECEGVSWGTVRPAEGGAGTEVEGGALAFHFAVANLGFDLENDISGFRGAAAA